MRSFLKSNQIVRLFAFILVIASAFPGAAQSTAVLLEKDGKAAANTCKKAVRYDKQLTDLQNRTVCYQAAVQGDRYARKMLHRSAFFAARTLRLYLDAAIPAATPDLESDPRHTKRLQRQQAAFWRKTKVADSDLLFLQDNAGLPYRIAKDTQKGKIAEIIVHFQKGLNTNIESTPAGATLAGRYLLSMPAGTWLIDDFEPVRMKLEITQIGLWLGDYVNYARSAYGNDIDLDFIALANQAGLSHFWLTGESGQDADFLRRNQGKGWGGEPPLITSLNADSDSGIFINIGFQKKESDTPDAPAIIDPLERAQYQVVKRDGQWYIASFKEIDTTQSVSGEAAGGEQWVFENAASVAKYLSQSQTLSKNLKACNPSEFTFSVPTTPPKKVQFIIQGSEGTLCRFKVMIVGAIGILCKAPSEAVEAQLAMERYWAEQLQTYRDGPFPLRLTADAKLADKLGKAMAKSCKVTLDEQPPVDMEKYINDTFAYIENLQICTPSTYSYPHPMVPGFIGKNVIKGYKDSNCVIDMHMPNNMIMKCNASHRMVELMQYQTRVMLKELQDSGRYEFSIEINVGTGSTSELSNLMTKECQW
jgi:hypothetical protein